MSSQFIMLYKVVLNFNCLDETSVWPPKWKPLSSSEWTRWLHKINNGAFSGWVMKHETCCGKIYDVINDAKTAPVKLNC